MATTLLDLDGVINNWVTPFNPYLCKVMGYEETPWLDWYHYRNYGCSDEQFVKILHQFADEGLFTAAPPFEGTVEALQRLHSMGHTIHVVTDRPPQIAQETQTWLKEHDIPFDTFDLGRDKTIFKAHGPGPYYGIDDRDSNTRALLDAGVRAYVLEWPWNIDSGLPSVKSVAEYVDIVIEEQLLP